MTQCYGVAPSPHAPGEAVRVGPIRPSEQVFARLGSTVLHRARRLTPARLTVLAERDAANGHSSRTVPAPSGELHGRAGCCPPPAICAPATLRSLVERRTAGWLGAIALGC